MKMYKYRIYPSKAQETQLNQQLELCRWAYNKTLETRKNSYEQDGVSLSYYDTKKMLPIWKADKPDLKRVHSMVLQDVTMRVDLAFQAFFRRVKSGEEEVGYPRFKGYGRYDSMCYPQYGNGAKLNGNMLALSKVGSIKVKMHRELCGGGPLGAKTVCIRRSAGGKCTLPSPAITKLCVCQTSLGGLVSMLGCSLLLHSVQVRRLLIPASSSMNKKQWQRHSDAWRSTPRVGCPPGANAPIAV